MRIQIGNLGRKFLSYCGCQQKAYSLPLLNDRSTEQAFAFHFNHNVVRLNETGMIKEENVKKWLKTKCQGIFKPS